MSARRKRGKVRSVSSRSAGPRLLWSADETSSAHVLKAKDARGGRYSIAARQGGEGAGWVVVAHDVVMPHGKGDARVVGSLKAAKKWAQERMKASLKGSSKSALSSKAHAPAKPSGIPSQRQLDRALARRTR